MTDLAAQARQLLRDTVAELHDDGESEEPICDSGDFAYWYGTEDSVSGQGYGLTWYGDGDDMYVSADYETDTGMGEIRDTEVLGPEDVARIRAWARAQRHDREGHRAHGS